MNRRTLVRCALALPFAIGLACGSDTTAPIVVTSVVGTWKLTSVDGKPLPYVVGASDPRLEVIDKQYVITSAGTFTTSFTLRATELDGTVSTSTSSDTGTMTLADNTVTFTYTSNGSTAMAAATPTTLTFAGAATQVFTKQ